MNRAEILLTINSNLEGIRKANEAFIDLQRTARNSASELNKTGKLLGGIGADFKSSLLGGVGLGAGFTVGAAAASVLLGAVRQVVGAVKDSVSQGVRFNATLEQSALGVASVLKQFNPGKYRDFSSAIADSGIIIDALKKKALETSATFEELLTAYQGTAGAMASAGIPLGKQVGLIVNISQAMAALGIRTEEMRQEATALMMGNIDRNARLAQTLGITGDQIRAMREQGRLYEFLTEKLKSFADASVIAQNNIVVLESNLKDAKTQVAADQTKELAGAYKELLQSLTELVKSDAFKETVHFFGMMTAGLVQTVKGVADAISGVGKTPIQQALAGNARDLAGFQEKASGVRSPEDIAAAQYAGRQALRWMEATKFAVRKTEYYDPKAYDPKDAEAVNNMIAATRAELELLEKEGAQRIENNKKADDAAKIEALSANLAKEAAKAREEGVKKYAEESEKAQARIRTAAKGVDPAWYIQLLNADKASLTAKLNGADSKPERYLGSGDFSDPDKVRAAKTAADAFRLEISAKIAAIEKEIDATQDAQHRKTKAEQDRKEKAEIKYLSVKAQEGTLQERIDALQAEKNGLDKTDLNYKADALAIDQRIAHLKDDEAARLRSEQQKAAQRAQEAESQRIRDNQFLTDRQRREQLYLAFKREQLAIADKIRAAEDLVKSQPEGSATRAQAQGELDTLYTRRDVGLPHDLETNRPLSMLEETAVAMAQLQDTFRTVASSIADVMGSAISGVSDGLQGLIKGTMTLGQAAWTALSGIGNAMIRVLSDMAAQWIIKHTLMAAWSKLFHAEEIATTATAEGAKTLATGAGAAVRTGIRTGETAVDVKMTAVKTAAHVTGEATKTSSTLLGSLIRIGSVIKEAIADVFKAGVGALSAMASIPYVGPILAVAAMGAIIAAGMGIVKGISKGFATGGYTSKGDKEEPAGVVHKGEWVAPKWMVDDPEYAGVIEMLEAQRRGKQGYSLGGFIKKFTGWDSTGQFLGSGMIPKWGQPKSFTNFQRDHNLLDGKKLYGDPDAQPVTVMDTRSDAQRSLDDLYVTRGNDSVGMALTGGPTPGGSSGMTVSNGSESAVVNIGYYNTRQDVEQWLKSQRGRRVMVDFMRGEQYDL